VRVERPLPRFVVDVAVAVHQVHARIAMIRFTILRIARSSQ
jgi:hypothetical protein